MGWGIAVAALGVAFIIVGAGLAFWAIEAKHRPVAVPLSLDAGLLVTGLGMVVVAIGLVGKLH